MISREMEIKIPSGLDPSTIALFIQIASQYDSTVYLETEGRRINAKSIMGMMSLNLIGGEEITVVTDGEDEQKAAEGIKTFFANV